MKFLKITLIVFAATGLLAGVFFAGRAFPEKTTCTGFKGDGFHIDTSGVLQFDENPGVLYAIGDLQSYFEGELDSVLTINAVKCLYVVRLWTPGGNGVTGYEDIGIRVADRSVSVAFRSSGSIERYLHDNFEPGVKAGEINAVHLSAYALKNNTIVEASEGRHTLHPIGEATPIPPRSADELGKIREAIGKE